MTTKFKGTAGSTGNYGGDFLAIRRVTADATGVLNSITFHVDAISLGIDFRAMLWTDSAGSASQLKDYSAKTTISTTGDKTLALTQGFSLTNGQVYWIGIVYICSSGQLTMAADNTNTYSSADYHRQAGTVATMRDSPTLNTPPDGVQVGLGASFMVWADQTTTQALSFVLDVGAFTLAGQTISIANSRPDFALGVGVFAVAGQAISFTMARGWGLDVGAFVFAGQATTRAIAPALATGVFTVTANPMAWQFAKFYSHEAPMAFRLRPRLQKSRVLPPILAEERQK